MNVLFIAPFLVDFIHPAKVEKKFGDVLIWPVYLDTFIRSKFPKIRTDLLYLPIEEEREKIKIDSIKDKEHFYSQMDRLVAELDFEVGNTLGTLEKVDLNG